MSLETTYARAQHMRKEYKHISKGHRKEARNAGAAAAAAGASGASGVNGANAILKHWPSNGGKRCSMKPVWVRGT